MTPQYHTGEVYMKTDGFIYAIGIEGRQGVKIGKTTGPIAKRLSMLQVGQPEPLALLAHVHVTQGLSQIEKAIHQFLAADRQRGEWFAVQVDQAQLEALIVRAVQWIADEEVRRAATPANAPPANATIIQRLAYRIRLRRLELRLSQESLGKAIGQDQSYVSKIERGEITEITITTLERLANALGVSTDALLGRKETDSEQMSTAVALVGA